MADDVVQYLPSRRTRLARNGFTTRSSGLSSGCGEYWTLDVSAGSDKILRFVYAMVGWNGGMGERLEVGWNKGTTESPPLRVRLYFGGGK